MQLPPHYRYSTGCLKSFYQKNQIKPLGRKFKLNLELLSLQVKEVQQDSGLSFNHV